jgi:4-diphosphocytidyl-2-C-methyl-D-erythritol kinase
MARLTSRAPAKVNLTLRVLARRTDGRHEIVSIVAFAGVGDTLAFTPGRKLDLKLKGPTAAAAGPVAKNFVLNAARELKKRVKRLKLGRFELMKKLPVGAGLGGGSADAAAALRLLAKANKLEADDPRLLAAAAATGADVPVALDPRAKLMTGTGDVLSPPLRLPPLYAVLVFPGVPAATANVYRTFDQMTANEVKAAGQVEHPGAAAIPRERAALLALLQRQPNDLTRAARRVTAAVAAAEEQIDEAGDARLIRMTGSGSCVFGLYDNADMAEASADLIRDERPDWWVVATTLR